MHDDKVIVMKDVTFHLMSCHVISSELSWTEQVRETAVFRNGPCLFSWGQMTCDSSEQSSMGAVCVKVTVELSVSPINLARSANLPTGLYILLALISFFFLIGVQLSQDLPDRFLQSFHRIKAFLVKLTDMNFFLQFLKGLCHGNEFWVKLTKWPSFSRLAFRNCYEYGSSYSKICNGNIVATSCANVIKIGLVTPELMMLTTAPFWTKRQKLTYPAEYFGNYHTDLHQLFSTGMYGDYKTDISFAV